ncbi:uncharacterized protein LOC132554733 [Ylistrum balloti]|uniref:uncharacterized protein LOC132554733 n=1 Tax=Ylistrum balloti TaxID=509963 RepID=UPI002905F331|nr:uncharacterized protein LOC132554733 [Ylistrum balloti]
MAVAIEITMTVSALAVLLSIILNGLGILVFSRCRLLVLQIRLILLFITVHSFFISCIFPVVMVVDYNTYHIVPCALKSILWAGYRIVPVVLTTVFALDRLVSVVWPLSYQRNSTKKSVLIICISLTLVLYVIFGLSFNNDIEVNEGICSTYLHMNEFGLHSMVMIFASSVLLTTVSYAVIFYQSKRYLSATSFTSTDNLYNTFRMSFLICGVTFALYMISITSCASSVALWYDKNNQNIFNVYLVCSILLITIISINPLFYISRFRESRFHVMKLLCLFKKNTERMESMLRLEQAGIPLPSHNCARAEKTLQHIAEVDSKVAFVPNNPIFVIST